MPSNPKGPRVWPTQMDQLRRDTIATCDRLDTRLGVTSVAIDKLQSDLAQAHVAYVRRELVTLARKHERAKDGAPDDLRLALAIIADLRAGRPAEHRADALLAQYALET